MRATLLFTALLLSLGLSFTLFSTPVHSQDDPQAISDQIQKLLNERRDVARELVKEAKDEYQVGRKTLEIVLNARNVLLEAELPLAKTDRERIELHEQRITNCRRLEQEVEAKRKVGAIGGSVADYNSAKAARLKAEYEFQVLSQATNNQIQSLLNERHDVARKWVRTVEAEYQVGTNTLADVGKVQNILLDIEMDLAKTKRERIDIHEQRIKNLRRIEQEIEAKLKIVASGGSVADYLSAKAARLKAEIDLLRERESR